MDEKKNTTEELGQENSKQEPDIKRLEIVYRDKSGWGCWGCFSFFLIISAMIVLGIVYVASASGIGKIPVFSDMWYHPVVPSQKIASNPVLQENVEQDIQKQLQTAVYTEVKKNPKAETVDVILTLNNEQLTALARNYVQDEEKISAIVTNPQILIKDDFLEFFTEIEKPGHTVVLLVIKPSVVDSVVFYEILQTILGSLDIPAQLMKFFVEQVPMSDINKIIVEMLSDDAVVKDINLSEGFLDIGLTVKVQ